MNNTTTNKNIKNQNIDWTEIQSQMKNKLGSEVYESWLKKIDFLDELPRTGTGKIQKQPLREPYWKEEDRRI